MGKILSGEVKMKPKWYFVLGSAFWLTGAVGLFAGAIFIFNLILFLLRKRGPGIHRLELLLDSFPAWLPVVALICVVAGIILLKKYDFSYKKNFKLLIAGLIVAVVISAVALDASGLNEIWSKRGPIKNLYPRQNSVHQKQQLPEYTRRL